MSLRSYLNKIKPSFEEGGKLHAFKSVFDGFETFLYVPNTTAKSGAHIHDAIDSKRIMSMVVIALMPALLFGMYNVGYQNYLAAGTLQEAGFFSIFFYGFLAVLPKILVSYIVGLGIEFIWAQWKGEEIQEGYLVSGIIIPLIVPVGCPLWILAIACAFAVIFAKEIYGGTGYNIFNVALIARAFLFFAYPSQMTGDHAFIREGGTWGWDSGKTLVDGFSGATPLGDLATATDASLIPVDFWTAFNGLIPGSVGETCGWAILLGACLLICTGVARWKTMLSILATAGVTAASFNAFGPDTAVANYPWYMHLVSGGLLFGAVFMATDPVTSARTECGKCIYGALIGFLVIVIRVLNPGFPEGMMLAILFGNAFAPLIDWCVVRRNINKRMKRA